MSEMSPDPSDEGRIVHSCELDEGDIPVRVIEVVQFMNTAGQMENGVRWAGSRDVPAFLGMLEYGKFQIWDAHIADQGEA